MGRSRKLVSLDRRIRALRAKFLPRRFSATGSYTADQILGAAIFRILAGAEFETYFEDMAKERLADALALTNQSKNSRMFGFLMSLYKAEKMGGIPAQFGEIDVDRFALSAEIACIHAHRRFIESNQGFKSHNVLKMFVPIGIDETKIPEQLFIDLDALASRRGDVAHNALSSVINVPNPQDDKELVFRIVSNLKEFEGALFANVR